MKSVVRLVVGITLLVGAVSVVLLCLKIFEHSGVRVMAEGDYDAQTRIQTLLEYIHEREAELDERAEQKRVKLHQCVQLRHLENEARQVNMWIRNSESMITAGLVCPGSLHEAEQLRKEHDQFQPAIEARPLLYLVCRSVRHILGGPGNQSHFCIH